MPTINSFPSLTTKSSLLSGTECTMISLFLLFFPFCGSEKRILFCVYSCFEESSSRGRNSHAQFAAVFCFPLQARVMEEGETPQACAASRTPANSCPVVRLRTGFRACASLMCFLVSSVLAVPFRASRIFSRVSPVWCQPCSRRAPWLRLYPFSGLALSSRSNSAVSIR